MVIVLRASEYSSWMALMRPGCGEEESWSRGWCDPKPAPRKPECRMGTLMHQGHHFLSKFAPREPETPSGWGAGPAHLYSRGTLPTHCCWPARGTQTWTPASRPGRTSCSVGSSAAGGSAVWPARPRRAAGWRSGAERARSFKKERNGRLKPSHNNSSSCL